MRYSADRAPWRQRKWWLDGIAFAALFPLVVRALGEGGGPARAPILGYLLEVAAALAAWGVVGWLLRLWRTRGDS